MFRATNMEMFGLEIGEEIESWKGKNLILGISILN